MVLCKDSLYFVENGDNSSMQYRMISIKTYHESIKSWAWVGIEDRIGIGPGSNYNEGPKLGIGPGSIFRAQGRIRIEILGIDSSLHVRIFGLYEWKIPLH